MDWFDHLTGFAEMGYHETRARLVVEGRELVSRVTEQRHGIGKLELVSLQDLRVCATATRPARRKDSR